MKTIGENAKFRVTADVMVDNQSCIKKQVLAPLLVGFSTGLGIGIGIMAILGSASLIVALV